MKYPDPHTADRRIALTTVAVYHGDNTAKRLAARWSIVDTQATKYLLEAYRAGFLTRVVKQEGRAKYFVYSTPPPVAP
jgi:hypothetical protein